VTGRRIKDSGECPTCGQKLPPRQELRVDSEIGAAVANGRAVMLTPTEAELLTLIVSTGTRVATNDFLISGLYNLDEPSGEIIKVWIHHLRKKLSKIGVSIETVWGKGVRISLKERG
jgi:DNA-binding response OmpR family regulator